ncbi:MAG: lipopolysaccharide export system permease protein [Alphaproteobacteria bacterium]|jgi:lipopolysaccharide export system permease protein|nr:lipopolysaccharide export system permease protein [Alphaproteobacteria bacterium]
MIAGTLSRYFGLRFLGAVVFMFVGLLVMVGMVDFLEMLRRTGDMKDISALLVAKVSLYRVPYLTERILPFAVLVGTMFCYLNLSRRLELVVARSSGVSAWQFVAPALYIAMAIGVLATTLYNPISAALRERSVRLEAQLFRGDRSAHDLLSGGFWVRQRTEEFQAIINAKSSSQQGIELAGVTVFRFDDADRFLDRIEAKSAVLRDGFWLLRDVRIYAIGVLPVDRDAFELKTFLTFAQVRESFATPDTVPFWELSSYIRLAENAGLAAVGYRLQYYQLLALPFYLGAMVLLAAAVSLRSFRFGGVQKMVLGAIVVGFLLYVMSKITGDLSKAGLMPPLVAAGLPTLLGGLTGLLALLYQEDG